MPNPLRVLVAGCGNMGASHARAYHKMADFEIVGLVSRGPSSRAALSQDLGGLPQFSDYYEALKTTKPDVVSINTYPETHGPYARAALEAGCHVFCEKPLAETVEEAQSIVDAARRHKRKLVIGYILRVHPAWIRFIELARTLGKPLVMRMNLNQQSHGPTWTAHRNLMNSMSPIVDCGVHYVDVMCQMTGAAAAGVRDRRAPERRAQARDVQLRAAPGDLRRRVGGLVRSRLGPDDERGGLLREGRRRAEGLRVDRQGSQRDRRRRSDDIDSHTKTNCIRVHHGALDGHNEFVRPDEFINTEDEPDHQGLCDREQAFFLRAIQQDWICPITCTTPSTACASCWPPTRACGRGRSWHSEDCRLQIAD